jgi:hypothetical protein
MARVLQIDFPAQGPWADEMAGALRDLAETIAAAPGLRWKIWTESEADGRAGGIYVFDDDASAQRYLEEHTVRLRAFGIEDVRAVTFDVNEPLTAVTNGPVGATA